MTTFPSQDFLAPLPGVWSAPPTPLTEQGDIDLASVRRSVDRHIALGCDGVLLAGTCGEGPWLRQSQREALVRTSLEQAGDSLHVSVQVTDNSPGLILDQIDAVSGWGARIAVVAQPYFFMNSTPARLRDFYSEIWEHSCLPVIFYDRGQNAPVPTPLEILEEVVSHPKVAGVKDSSCDIARTAILSKVRNQRPDFRMLTGNEFDLLPMLKAGYDGAFYGGSVISARAVRQCIALFTAGEVAAAEKLDEEIKCVLLDIYGGPKITCWLAGLKYFLVRLGVFESWFNIPGYPLTVECRQAIDQVIEEVPWLR